jgi:hypothetical protein
MASFHFTFVPPEEIEEHMGWVNQDVFREDVRLLTRTMSGAKDDDQDIIFFNSLLSIIVRIFILIQSMFAFYPDSR